MKPIGILGGGQLAKFLSLSSKNSKSSLEVLSPSKKDPAAQNNPQWIKGDPHNLTDLKKFLKNKQILSFESEFFSAEQIKKALNKKTSLIIAPSLKNLKNIQDRFYQKKLLKKYDIQTADFISIEFKNNKPELQKRFLDLWNHWGSFVLKNRTGGYDGSWHFSYQKKISYKKTKSS